MSELTDRSLKLEVELQLQQELRAMFDVDSQRYLLSYLHLVERLNSQSWTADMQEMYRAIHTIKGGSVTVGAEACLKLATVLEDLLSDLRHLSPAPPLGDGRVAEMLQEAGELLASSLQIEGTKESAIARVQPSVERVQALHEQIKASYLSDWNEQRFLHQEFADQGFGLVVLDLEMAVDKLASQGTVPQSAIDIATQTLAQLSEIGQDLEFTPGWSELIDCCHALVGEPSVEMWRSQWSGYLAALQESARQGGKAIAPTFTAPLPTKDWFPESDAFNLAEFPVIYPDLSDINFDSLAIASFELDIPVIDNCPETAEIDPNDWSALEGLADLSNLDDFSDDSELIEDDYAALAESTQGWLGLVSPDPQAEITVATVRSSRADLEIGDLQIPVPLERLDKTAQTLVETLLSVRASQGVYQNLQSQLAQLLVLAQDSAQYITELRKLQDSYALLDDLKTERHSTDSPTLERYRQGYSTINRLLETSLRLSELGAEANKSAQQTSNNLKNLDRNVLRLRQNIEQSRLVPFKNLAFRAKAVLRDLTIRGGKQAQIVIEGEQIELDAATVSQIEPAILHLIRNAYDHGLESTPERISSGKSESGTITLSLKRSGSRYLLELKDDGRGIDANRIRQSATAKGLPLTQTDTYNQLLAVICQPGFSTQEVVSDISGRGVGMDVVANQIEALGGRLRLETKVGRGTTFQLQFPVPQLLVSCVLLRVGDRPFAIPVQDIATTAIWDTLPTTSVEDTNTIYSWEVKQGEISVPALYLMDYWQPQSLTHNIPSTAIALRVYSVEREQSLWIVVDDLIEQTELLLTPLPNPLEAPVGVLGVSLRADGSLIPAIDAAMLVEIISQTTQPAIADPLLTLSTVSSEPLNLPYATRTILVVDDAALMRRRIEASLTAYGYSVVTCGDGLEAWNWLQSHTIPAMLITDVEMPNMDGFTLIDRVRQSGITMPIMVVSSRLAEEWSKEAQRLGANDYLTKGFTTQDLVSKVEALL
ncbi:hybrid sensor histidine kinase/response regulator [Merismopedia glauca]|uniref:histidine kinase n=1 Tax=Merismopedia glauca CCAP 1448/3 TaxID=1296344 RepID=A0A2T1C7F3_9CYAN|nr:response regulator [Merismopedia glauca]PSB04073.1 hybrid sensor histidine kinase/response regulator [Merismopedia glauca CCAP 1448/3]